MKAPLPCSALPLLLCTDRSDPAPRSPHSPLRCSPPPPYSGSYGGANQDTNPDADPRAHRRPDYCAHHRPDYGADHRPNHRPNRFDCRSNWRAYPRPDGRPEDTLRQPDCQPQCL